jgi:hypothetical protein
MKIDMYYPTERYVSEQEVRVWLADAIANNEVSNQYGEPESLDINTLHIEYVIQLLNDGGRVSLALRNY